MFPFRTLKGLFPRLLWSQLHKVCRHHSRLMKSCWHSRPCFLLQGLLLSIGELQVIWKYVVNHVRNSGNTCSHKNGQMSFYGQHNSTLLTALTAPVIGQCLTGRAVRWLWAQLTRKTQWKAVVITADWWKDVLATALWKGKFSALIVKVLHFGQDVDDHSLLSIGHYVCLLSVVQNCQSIEPCVFTAAVFFCMNVSTKVGMIC